jgi:hypothetical protein
VHIFERRLAKPSFTYSKRNLTFYDNNDNNTKTVRTFFPPKHYGFITGTAGKQFAVRMPSNTPYRTRMTYKNDLLQIYMK